MIKVVTIVAMIAGRRLQVMIVVFGLGNHGVVLQASAISGNMAGFSPTAGLAC